MEKFRNEQRKNSGGDYYATQAAYLGERYLKLVFGRHYQGQLSLEQVADYLGVKTKSVAGLEELPYKGPRLRNVTPCATNYAESVG